MTSFDVGNVIKDRLQAAGLSQYLDDAKEQYLEFPDGFFAEVVLKDGSKLSEVQRLVKSIEEELKSRVSSSTPSSARHGRSLESGRQV